MEEAVNEVPRILGDQLTAAVAAEVVPTSQREAMNINQEAMERIAKARPSNNKQSSRRNMEATPLHTSRNQRRTLKHLTRQ